MIPHREWAGSTEHHGRYTELHLRRKSPEEGSLRGETETLWWKGTESVLNLRATKVPGDLERKWRAQSNT